MKRTLTGMQAASPASFALFALLAINLSVHTMAIEQSRVDSVCNL